jgi:hypothetical protein
VIPAAQKFQARKPRSVSRRARGVKEERVITEARKFENTKKRSRRKRPLRFFSAGFPRGAESSSREDLQEYGDYCFF